tara:strand:+ start:285 stop:443 length:159 start_codon:yes stop_codon:yes gene_type:complete
MHPYEKYLQGIKIREDSITPAKNTPRKFEKASTKHHRMNARNMAKNLPKHRK